MGTYIVWDANRDLNESRLVYHPDDELFEIAAFVQLSTNIVRLARSGTVAAAWTVEWDYPTVPDGMVPGVIEPQKVDEYVIRVVARLREMQQRAAF